MGINLCEICWKREAVYLNKDVAAEGSTIEVRVDICAECYDPDAENRAHFSPAFLNIQSNCLHIGVDGCCQHPKGLTPECHENDCPLFDALQLEQG